MNATPHSVRLKRWEFPNYWDEIIEPVESSEQLIARLKELTARVELADAAGVTYMLEDDAGNELEVHCSEREWAVAYFPADGTPVISLGNPKAKGTRPFLIPEWTEVEQQHLVDRKVGEVLVKHWITTGELSDIVQWVE